MTNQHFYASHFFPVLAAPPAPPLLPENDPNARAGRAVYPLARSLFFEVDKLRDRVDVCPVIDSVFLFHFVKDRTGEVVPTKFGNKSIPDHQIALIKAAAILVAPFENFLVRPAFQHPLCQDAVIHPKKIRARAIRGFRTAEIRVIFFGKFATCVEPDLVQHSGEIHHSLGHFLRAFRIRAHK